jgi:hypothetical protein
MKKILLLLMIGCLCIGTSIFAATTKISITFKYTHHQWATIHKMIISYIDPITYKEHLACVGLGTSACPMSKTVTMNEDEYGHHAVWIKYVWPQGYSYAITGSDGWLEKNGEIDINGYNPFMFYAYYTCDFK